MRLGGLSLTALVISGAAWAAVGDSWIITGDVVNVRAGPSTDAPVVMRVYRDQQVIEVQRDGEWVRAEIAGQGGREGWIYAPLLTSPEAADPTAEGAGDVAEPQAVAADTPSEEPEAEQSPASPGETDQPSEALAAVQPPADAEAGSEAAPPSTAGSGGIAQFRESVDYLNSRAMEVAGVDLFTGVEAVGEGVVQVSATDAWRTVPPGGQRSYLNTLIDRWAAAKGGDGPVSVQIVDSAGTVLAERSTQ